ncbi:hypothetical protein HPB50_018408 [Hyalomma asiaticum]|uniref:Uncharacterized protein n=1 Tax=Hyalomma asiaticum TaxID=266040 RepID=A0ACB7TB90_HYAAI|nr:hypothetical protein HPB50_018408 [Hyalomma asiaticum]
MGRLKQTLGAVAGGAAAPFSSCQCQKSGGQAGSDTLRGCLLRVHPQRTNVQTDPKSSHFGSQWRSAAWSPHHRSQNTVTSCPIGNISAREEDGVSTATAQRQGHPPLPGPPGISAPTWQTGEQLGWGRLLPLLHFSPSNVSALDAEYKKQIEVLRAQNELLLNKIQNLESKLASAPSPQNSDAMESDAEPSPALVATISAIEERLTSKMKSMIETAMDQILTKVMTTVPALVSKHISDNPRLLRRLGPVKDWESGRLSGGACSVQPGRGVIAFSHDSNHVARSAKVADDDCGDSRWR